MIRSGAKDFEPKLAQKSIAEMKAAELHGETAKKYGGSGNKRDGALMANGADWKNT